jgi:antitoxin component of MazEF toxin-antitoxin module
MKQTKFRDDVKLNNTTLYVSIPKKSARSIGLKEGETVDVTIKKKEDI